jgi:hypothetical protein
MQKKLIFYFSHTVTCPQAHHLQSKKIILLLKFCVKILVVLQALFQSAQHIYVRKEKDPEPDPDPLLLVLDPDPDPGGPKTFGSCGSGFPTVVGDFEATVNRTEVIPVYQKGASFYRQNHKIIQPSILQ